MITSKKDLKEWLTYEKSLYITDGRHYSNKLIFKYIRLLRKCEYYKNTAKRNYLKKVIFKILDYQRRSLGLKLGFEVGLNVFEKGLKIFHTGSLIINGGTKVGENCSIIGSACLGGKGGSAGPEIGSNCELGMNSIVIGNIKVANHVRVGAGAVVTRSIEEPFVNVAGVPAKIVSRDSRKVEVLNE